LVFSSTLWSEGSWSPIKISSHQELTTLISWIQQVSQQINRHKRPTINRLLS
jgi:hypothetical protein